MLFAWILKNFLYQLEASTSLMLGFTARSISFLVWEGEMTFEEALIWVWRQLLVEESSTVEVDGKKYPVRSLSGFERLSSLPIDAEFSRLIL